MSGERVSLMTGGEQRDLLAALLGAVLSCWVIDWVLTPTAVFPMHHDDYAVLGASLRNILALVERPVSTYLAYAMGHFGIGFSYSLLNLLTAIVPGLVLAFVLQLFHVRGSLLAGAAFGLVVFGHSSAIEHGRYLGLITNLTSHAFGVGAMLLLLSGWRSKAWLSLAAGILSYALSAFAKEDFLLPPLLLIAHLMLEDRMRQPADLATKPHRCPLQSVLMATFVGIAIVSVGYNFFVRSPFLAGLANPAAAADPYALTLTPMALWSNFLRLTWEYAYWQCLVWIGGMLLLVIFWPARFRTWVFLLATTIAVVLPYVPLGNNAPEYRAFAWLPWLCAPAFVAASLGWSERSWVPGFAIGGKLLAPTCLAVALAVSSMDAPRRSTVAGWYAAIQARNARMVHFITTYKPAIDHDRVVGVAGVEGLSPWSKTSGRFLQRKLGLVNDWVVFVDKPNIFFPLGPGHAGSKITVVLSAAACEAPDMLVVRFDAEGNGALVRGRQVCDEAKVNRGS
ncbi:MAG TPA: hypothetical protein VFE82_16470 [Ramlibacter sp.]|jgi:hypothetical protein|uniref:hypothetical protein n=1 Tax=Ramlibacter sp. TaxID=1917967 RepID=UPI002D31A003|nr:hypothetical protein [Ramlibacter sp.]HZY20067.1 hypothetical protein [Ramlibacter sp.]